MYYVKPLIIVAMVSDEKLFATVLTVSVCADFACLHVRINGAYAQGHLIPKTYPNNSLCQITQLLVHIEDKEGLRPQDIAKVIPGEDIVAYLDKDDVIGIKLQRHYPSPQQILAEILSECNK